MEGGMISQALSFICVLCILSEVKLQKANRNHVKEDDEFSLKTGKDDIIVKRSIGSFDYLQEIVKCCPKGFQMDNWYKCVKNNDVRQDIFADELLEIGAKDKEKYVIIHSNAWKECPMVQRKEFKVLHIPHHKNHTVYVFVDIEINFDEEEINFDGFREMKYSCLEVSKDHQSITALVCENKEVHEGDEKGSFIKKCCPNGKGLSRNYSSCEKIAHKWVAPRAVLHHKTEEMTGTYQLVSDQELCGAEETLIVETARAVTTDGMFMDTSEGQGPQSYHCVDTLVLDDKVKKDKHEAELVALICLKKGCTSDFCVSKCCPENEIFIPEEALCSPAIERSHLWTHHNKLYDNLLKLIPHEILNNTKVEYHNHFLGNTRKYQSMISHCVKVAILDKSYNDTFLIIQNGSLYHKDHGFSNDFCVDNTVDDLGNVNEIALKCVEATDEAFSSQENLPIKSQSCLDEYVHILRLLNTVSGSISCVSLAITFLVYIFVPELNNLHGKIVLSNVFTIFLLTAYLLFICYGSNLLSTLYCKIAGYIGYFLTMAMFSWMTIMSFDLCWTFMRAKLPSKGSAVLKFGIYSVVAWGSSLVLTIAIVLADLMMEDQSDTINNFFPKPNVGLTKCFLHDDSQGVYLHVPIMLFMLVNGMFFITTIITLYRSSLTTQKARNSRQKPSGHLIVSTTSIRSRINQETKEQLMCYGKLFTVMGILWIFECVHYLVHGDHTNMECLSSSEFFLGIIGCINLFRGSLIFFIFVCKDSTINKLLRPHRTFIDKNNIDNNGANISVHETQFNRIDSEPVFPLVILQDSSVPVKDHVESYKYN